jgi:hypothetical protein
MSEFRLASEAEGELDEIWLYIARQSGSIDILRHVSSRKSPTVSGYWHVIRISAAHATTI